MKEIILIKNGELALKGLNRSRFEDALIKNCANAVRGLGKFRFTKAQSTIYCENADGSADLDEAVRRLRKVFGMAGLVRSLVCEKTWEEIALNTPLYLREELESAKTFRVSAKRADKSFPMDSPTLCMELGGVILEKFPHLKVDLYNPEVEVTVEIRDFGAYIHTKQLPGAGGMPVGTSGRASLMLSGGIDSPVAGYMMAKRGLTLSAIHFISPPYTSDRAKEKVITLCEKMSEYCGEIKLFIVHFTDMQLKIREMCPEDLFTIIMRRYMVKVAEKLSRADSSYALITGESLAQVASQTLHAIACTDVATDMPILRPVIGMDKNEIVKIAREIDTFETSVLPYEDCCTVFTPKHPKTKPKLYEVERAEAAFDATELIEKCVESVEVIKIG